MSVTRFLAAVLALAVVAAATLALWPASEADKARDDGERVGQAVNQLYYADSTTEVDAALDELHGAVADSRDHAGDALGEQVADQEDALSRAADGVVGSLTSESDFDAELYEAELDYALDDLTSQASDFRTNAPEVEQAFWEGVDSGLNAS
jgi:ABC-type sugar transport system substrate-binding protein